MIDPVGPLTLENCAAVDRPVGDIRSGAYLEFLLGGTGPVAAGQLPPPLRIPRGRRLYAGNDHAGPPCPDLPPITSDPAWKMVF